MSKIGLFNFFLKATRAFFWHARFHYDIAAIQFNNYNKKLTKRKRKNINFIVRKINSKRRPSNPKKAFKKNCDYSAINQTTSGCSFVVVISTEVRIAHIIIFCLLKQLSLRFRFSLVRTTFAFVNQWSWMLTLGLRWTHKNDTFGALNLIISLYMSGVFYLMAWKALKSLSWYFFPFNQSRDISMPLDLKVTSTASSGLLNHNSILSMYLDCRI